MLQTQQHIDLTGSMDAGSTRVKIVTHRRSCHYNCEDFTFFRDLHHGSFCGLDTCEGRDFQKWFTFTTFRAYVSLLNRD